MSATVQDLVVQLKTGKIRGRKDELPNGKEYYFYKGIPYAKQPMGELRFKPPVRLEKFNEEVLDCSYERNTCPALINIPPLVAVGEDCLYANVYTPIDPVSCVDQQEALLPVMVWIYGGGFNAGSGDSSWYNPRFLLQEGVIVVTFNYRIGPLGFLCLPSKGIHGNMGLKDQRFFLRWVQENISRFGGDPSNVTLFGESAGAASVYFHYLTDESRKCFHKAICQSGTPINVWVEQQNWATKTRQLAKTLGCHAPDNDDEVYKTLMTASALDLTVLSETCLSMDDQKAMRQFAFTPIIESPDSEEPFITESCTGLLSKPNMTDIPLMIGFNSNEGIAIIPHVMPFLEISAKDTTSFILPTLQVPADKQQVVGEEIKRFYLKDAAISMENIGSLLDYVSDAMFILPSYVMSELHARFQHNAPQFCYHFDFVSELNSFKILSQQNNFDLAGASHADDLFYLFEDRVLGTPVAENSKANRMRQTMCKLWSNFAKCGNPTPVESELGFSWKLTRVISSEQQDYVMDVLDLSTQIRMMERPYAGRIQFWKEMFKKCGSNYLEITYNR